MTEALANARRIEDACQRAVAFQAIAGKFERIRRSIDALEEIVDNELWPLPKYRELLFTN